MIYHSKIIPDISGIRLIPVPEERLEKEIGLYKEIHCGDSKFKILDKVTIHRNDPLPTILTLLSIGDDLPKTELWKHYPKSNFIYFLVCRKYENRNYF